MSEETRYTYRIKAINGAGTSERSRWFHINTLAAPEPDNNPATGAPTISGTAQVGETLRADTTGIADEDGLSNADFSYQWLADDADIAGATGSTYTLTDSEEGNAIRVRVSFTDDADNEESLTSAATDAVAAEPSEPPDEPRGLGATATHDSVTLTWDDPGDDSITGYVILRRVRVNDTGGDFDVLVAETATAATTYTDDTVAASTTYTYRIKGHQPARGQRAVPLVPHRHPGGPVVAELTRSRHDSHRPLQTQRHQVTGSHSQYWAERP